ncbi:signal peptidase I [Granulicella cerasi]|uniref:Signal peptidase I n=1 Tax=Granulicella cerasi TaxID=741063 RepID=A0ABW1Z8J8_9BACT
MSHETDLAASARSQQAVAEANRADGKKPSNEPNETPLEGIASICTLLVVYLFVIGFAFQNFEIPSASMEKTLLIGDHLIVDRVSLSPAAKWFPLVHYRPVQHGDIIVFLKPHPEQPDLILVKRAIGLPGDHIHLEHGTVFINGKAQAEPYAQMPTDDGNFAHAYNPYRDDFPTVAPTVDDQLTELWRQELPQDIQNGDVVVPPGKVFAMGDNRTESLDSRFWGFVPVENIMGRPLFVYWSFQTPADQEDKTSMGDRIGFMFHVLIHIFDGTRWSRTLHVTR